MAAIIFPILFSIIFFAKLYIFLIKYMWKRNNPSLISFGFFHPYCNDGGGGERVLWAAIAALQKKYADVHCVVYSGDTVAAEEILRNVDVRFNIKLPRKVQIIRLRSRCFVEAKYHPFCTLLMQSVGSLVLGFEALAKHIPDVYIDTMGYAWTLPVFKFVGGSRVCAYVHYPTVSTDMLRAVRDRRTAVNNRQFISNSSLFSRLKLIYYRCFAYLYGLAGRRAELIMVNSSWTRDHILDLWCKPECTRVVYPPCDVSAFNRIPLERHDDKTRFLSIAQFRPEKDHELQIKAFHNFLNRSEFVVQPTLVLVGSCRHDDDFQRVAQLRELCGQLGISEHVEFRINLSFGGIVEEMGNASVALHTMRDEHFGIGIVECMSAGLIMIAHDSGGPKMDIVVDYNSKKTGFLAKDVHSFADAMERVWKMDYRDLRDIRTTARESVSRFSGENFENVFLSAIRPIKTSL